MNLLNHFLFTIHSLPSGGKKKHKQKKKRMEWLPVSKSPSTIVQRFQRKDKPEKNVAALKQASTVKALNNNCAACWCYEIDALDLDVL